MEIRLINAADDFRALRAEWELLLKSAEQASIFNSWEWQFYWWQHYGKGQPLCLVVVSDAQGVAGILPLYIQTRTIFSRIPVRLLRYIGAGGDTSPEYLGPIVRRDGAADIANRLAAFVLEEIGGWDVLYFTDMRADSAFRSAMSSLWTRNSLDQSVGVSARISFLNLPSSADDYFNSLDGHRRRVLRQHRRKFEGVPGARFFVWNDPATIDKAVDRLIELHRLRWRDRSNKHAFQSPEYVGFHRELIHACVEQGWLRFYCLAIGDRVIAMHYCYRFNGSVCHFQSGLDPDFDKLGPGVCLMTYTIEHAITEGNREYDMLRGEYHYKTQWMKDTRETLYFFGYRKNVVSLLFRVAHEHLPRVKSAVKRMLLRNRTVEK